MTVPDSPDPTDSLIRAGRAVIDIESDAVRALGKRLDNSFAEACELILSCNGRVIVTGMGKSGHISRKVAATMASTGTPAFFLHPADAGHGDMGMITRRDVVVALSNSGTTPELLTLIPLIKRLAVPLIAMTGSHQSLLAEQAAVHLDISVSKEACPLNLAPTASTSAQLAMGDALALAVSAARGFTAEDFALSHPGGSLGRRLLTRVEDIMHVGEAIPKVSHESLLGETLVTMSGKGLGMALIVNKNDQLEGVFTDGDLRRALDHGANVSTPVKELMTTQCTTVGPDMLAAEALQLLEARRINGLPVVSQGQVVGAFNVHDLLRAGVV